MKLLLNENQYILTENGIDISIPLKTGKDNVNAWYCDPVGIEPVVSGDFIGDVNQGGSVNFRNITVNPHGNGTHTECVGHISKENYTINQCLKEFHFIGQLISVKPKKVFNEEFQTEDEIIDADALSDQVIGENNKVLILRTLENSAEKITRQYSDSNPPYLTKEAIEYINGLGIEHLMVDMPSVDREVDNGKLAAHKAFWNYPESPLIHKTITELIYAPNNVIDDQYVVNVQITSLESDASPSKIVLYEILSVA